MRLRSPAAIAGTLVVACALALMGVALAVGGQVTEQRPWLDGVITDQHEPLTHGRGLARARRLPGMGPALARAVALTSIGVPIPAGVGQWPPAPSQPPGPSQQAIPPSGKSPAAAETSPPAETPAPAEDPPAPAEDPVRPPAEEPAQPPAADPPPPAAGEPAQPPPAQPTPPAAEPPPPLTSPNPPAAEPPPPLTNPNPTPAGGGPVSALYWGASIGSQLTGEQAPWDMGAVSEFEQIAGKQVSLVNFFSPFSNCPAAGGSCSFYRFPTGPMESIRSYGAIPVFSWASQSIPSRKSEPDYQLSDVTAGTYDSYIREFAEDARDWGHPFFLRFNWEMNGNWFPWGEGANGNRPGDYVAAWRHVHDVFTAVGADNVTWVWCPNVDPDGTFADLAPLYPGDEYVDWTGLDGYNWGLNPAKPDRWRSFDELYETTYHRIVDAVAPSKPLLIGEVGSTEEGGSKAAWIEEALTAIPVKYPKIGGLVWFDTYDDGMDWPIETSASAAGAFADGIQSPAYVEKGVASGSAGPIPPPS